MRAPTRASLAAAVLLSVALVLDLAAIGLTIVVARSPDALEALTPELFTVQLLGVAPFAVVGALLVSRRPTNPIGRLLLATGVLLAVFVAGRGYVSWDALDAGLGPGTPLVLVAAIGAFYVTSGLIVPRLLLLFPNGEPPSPRWRVVTVGQAFVPVLLLGVLLTPGDLGTGAVVENPLGIQALSGLKGVGILILDLLVDGLTVVCGASLIVRFRRADGQERSQLKWLAWGGGLAAISLVGHATLSPIAPWTNLVTYAIGGVAGWLFPIGIGIAVMRYRLYEIDRIISRTIGWAIVTGMLVGAFAGLVVGSTALLEPLTGGNTLAIAGSTLVVAALFTPVRSRVQALVDRRFDRDHHDSERLLAALGERLRDEVDLAAISADVLATVDAAVRPASAGLWLRERPGGGAG